MIWNLIGTIGGKVLDIIDDVVEGGGHGWLFVTHHHEGLLSLTCLRREFL